MLDKYRKFLGSRESRMIDWASIAQRDARRGLSIHEYRQADSLLRYAHDALAD